MSGKTQKATGRARIIAALDVDSFTKAERLIGRVYPAVRIFKVGSHLFTACGPKIIEAIRNKGAEAFLDLKFFDIPNTVANAVRAAVRLKVKMLSLHIAGGEDMLKAAVKAAADESLRRGIKPPCLIGVTILTSQRSSRLSVLRLARIGLSCGLDGVVCSAREISCLRSKIKKEFLIVAAGIRPQGYRSDDQSRTASAGRAMRQGADYIVVGRPIIEAKDPLAAVERLLTGRN